MFPRAAFSFIGFGISLSPEMNNPLDGQASVNGTCRTNKPQPSVAAKPYRHNHVPYSPNRYLSPEARPGRRQVSGLTNGRICAGKSPEPLAPQLEYPGFGILQ